MCVVDFPGLESNLMGMMSTLLLLFLSMTAALKTAAALFKEPTMVLLFLSVDCNCRMLGGSFNFLKLLILLLD